MKPTPIKIPGKNQRDRSKSTATSRKAQSRRLVPRPSNEDSISVIALAPKKIRLESVRNLKSRRKVSNLEKLPTELLQKIFLFCMNLELPRSSPLIGTRLTSSKIYHETVITGFGTTWCERWHGHEKVRVHHGNDDLVTAGSTPLQSSILRCRWASLPVILKAKQIWSRRCAPEQPFQACDAHQKLRPNDIEVSMPLVMSVEEDFNEDFQRFTKIIKQYGGEADRIGPIFTRTNDIASNVEIPISLLTGPWAEDKLKHLYWVIKSGAYVDWRGSTDGEVAFAGLKEAISMGNFLAVSLLMWAGLVERCDSELISWALQNVSGDKAALVSHLVSLIAPIMLPSDRDRLQGELLDMRVEAIENRDHQTFDWVDRLLSMDLLSNQRFQ